MSDRASERKEQEQEIMNQLGGGMFIAMTGAKHLSYDGQAEKANLSFKFFGSSKVNWIKIVLDDNDTYTVKFMRCRADKITVVSETAGVYNDMLQDLFKSVTGLNTRL